MRERWFGGPRLVLIAILCVGCVAREAYKIRRAALDGLRAQPRASLRDALVQARRHPDGKPTSVKAWLLLDGEVEKTGGKADTVIVRTRRPEARKPAGTVVLVTGLALLGVGLAFNIGAAQTNCTPAYGGVPGDALQYFLAEACYAISQAIWRLGIAGIASGGTLAVTGLSLTIAGIYVRPDETRGPEPLIRPAGARPSRGAAGSPMGIGLTFHF